MKKLFEGACTALVTPFRKGKVDYIAFKKLIEFQIKNKIDALLILGTTGETSTLSTGEKKEIIRFSFETIQGRVPLIFGIGGNNPTTIIELGKFVKECAFKQTVKIPSTLLCAKKKPNEKQNGVGVLVTSPYYNKSTQAGLIKYFNKIAHEVKLPLIVYNVPGRTGINIEPSTLAEISKNKYIAGIKEASGNIDQITRTIQLCPKTAVYSGDDAISVSAYAIGALGVISVASNANPHEVGEIYRLFKRRKVKEARELFFKQLPFYKALFAEVNPIPIKYVLSEMGFCKNELRLPLTPLSDTMKNAFCGFFETNID